MTATITRKPRRPLRRRLQRNKLLLHLILLAGSVVMLLPFFWMLSTSLKERSAIFAEFPPRWIPETFAWQNYADAWTAVPFDRFYLNSISSRSA